ncbi:hypothetical protein BH24ACT5_BH24ACT5_29440 [soil metagenome]
MRAARPGLTSRQAQHSALGLALVDDLFVRGVEEVISSTLLVEHLVDSRGIVDDGIFDGDSTFGCVVGHRLCLPRLRSPEYGRTRLAGPHDGCFPA